MAKNKYTFMDRKLSVSKMALMISSVSLLLFMINVLLAELIGNGKFAFLYGILALDGAILSLYGFYKGMQSIAQKGRGYRLTALITIYSGIVCILWIGVAALGLS